MNRNFVNVIVSDDGLTVTDTDGDASRWPDTTRIPNPSGETIYYHPIESKIELYLTKLGESLAYALRGSGVDVKKPVLTSLPKGYQVFERVRENESNVAIRKDTYLFGSDVCPKFNSPRDFEEHLLWLASDKVLPCRCKYCRKNQSRSSVSPESSIKREPSSKRSINSRQELVQMTKSKKPKVSTNDNRSSPENLDDKDQILEKRTRTFRIGEIVWADVRHVLTESQRNELGSKTITYWPAFIQNHFPAEHVLADESPEVAIQYNLRIILLNDNVRLKPSGHLRRYKSPRV